MKVFHCDHCRQMAFFENTRCVSCGHLLAFLPDLLIVGSLDPVADDALLWTSPLPSAAGRRYRLCANYRERQVCNWVVDAAGESPLCTSCQMTRVIPDLSIEGYHAAWYRLEVAKRRLLYTLLKLRLPFGATEGQPMLVFQFLSDRSDADAPILTGHADGLVTINLGEAYDAERERRRHALGEAYRTVIGHMRHEVGHYFWMRLVASDPARLERFRALFGDDREDYGDALRRHYDSGPPADWQERFVTPYASAHAWEDWAETWAHYLHMIDTLETVSTSGVVLRPLRADEPSLDRLPPDVVSAEWSFEQLLDSWFPITYLINNLNRGLGMADAYPFVLSSPAIDKLRFVHECIAAAPIPSSGPAGP